MRKSHKKYYYFFAGGLLTVLFLDLFTKWLVVQGRLGERVFINHFFYLMSLQKNEGIAFSIPIPRWIQVIGSLLILFLLMKFGFEIIKKKEESASLESLLLGIVVGGGLGNLIDRIMNGYVIDFIVLGPIPVFNVADVGITVGLLLLFATMILPFKKYEC